jgi:TatD DNase family protein
MEFVDSHCHIHFDTYNFGLDPEEVLADSLQAGVKRLICVGTTIKDSQKAADFAVKHAQVWASAGVHPHDAAGFLEAKDSADKLKALLEQPKIVAIGEIGLDYYRSQSSKDDQTKALRRQIEVGQETGLPFIFHVRDAWEDFWPIFDSYEGLQGIIHSFTAHPSQLEDVLKRKLFVSLNGIMTFTKDEKQLEAAKLIPRDKLLLETDAPFLTPKPFRGQTCQPKHVINTAEFLAELRGESLEEIATYTTKNAENLFDLT